MIRLRLRTLSTDRRFRQAKRTTKNRLRARIAPARCGFGSASTRLSSRPASASRRSV